MRLHCLMHVPFEGPARIADWAEARGHSLAFSHLFAGDSLPDVALFDRLIIMGGPMGVADLERYPWLDAEKRCIAGAIEAGRSLVGICLGAQLIAEVLGASVTPNPEKEIGWFPIRLTAEGRQHPLCQGLASEQQVLHWHGDTFSLPPGAVWLAESDACENQAFLARERILGLQFHLEMTPASVEALCANAADDLVPAPHVQSAAQMLSVDAERYAATGRTLEMLLDRLPV
jgi:GMP synthase-like glutamine amidotransferase